MSRLIDADELKTAFPCGESVRTECVRATIDHMPTIKPEPCNCSEIPNNWIPNTKETVPKDPRRKQIQLKNGWIITGWFDDEDWFPVPEVGAGLLFDNVEAWCELPEPYQPESEEKHDT